MVVIALRYDEVDHTLTPVTDDRMVLADNEELYFLRLADSGDDVTLESFNFRPQQIGNA
jgi:hypothetical protein